MKKENSLRTLSIVLLLLNGIPALLAGGSMISDPTGAGLRMDVNLLEFSPFHTFLIPGIILFTMNGLFSFVTLTALLMRNKYYPLLLICQGLILTGWVTVQIVIVMNSSWLQLMYGFSGLALIISGLSLENILSVKSEWRNLLKLVTSQVAART